MRHAWVLLLFIGCSSTQPEPEPGPSPSEMCHLVFDSICAHSTRCEDDYGMQTPEEYYQGCLDFMAGKVLFNGNEMNFRDVCDKITYVNSSAPSCVLALADDITCEWPAICNEVIMQGEPDGSTR